MMVDHILPLLSWFWSGWNSFALALNAVCKDEKGILILYQLQHERKTYKVKKQNTNNSSMELLSLYLFLWYPEISGVSLHVHWTLNWELLLDPTNKSDMISQLGLAQQNFNPWLIGGNQGLLPLSQTLGFMKPLS